MELSPMPPSILQFFKRGVFFPFSTTQYTGFQQTFPQAVENVWKNRGKVLENGRVSTRMF